MATIITDSQHYSDIADTIREKTKSSKTYTPSKMPDGVGEVYEAGKNDEWSTFWDNYQKYGNETFGEKEFYGSRWNDKNFKPKYDIVGSGKVTHMFSSNSITDLAGILDKYGVEINLLNVDPASSMIFAYGQYTIIPSVNYTTLSQLGATFISNHKLHTIVEMVLREDGSQTFNKTFDNCENLRRIGIKGKIGKNGFNVQWATELEHDTLVNILNVLQDKSTDTSGTIWKITIGSKNLAKLDEETELVIAWNKGWVIE